MTPYKTPVNIQVKRESYYDFCETVKSFLSDFKDNTLTTYQLELKDTLTSYLKREYEAKKAEEEARLYYHWLKAAEKEGKIDLIQTLKKHRQESLKKAQELRGRLKHE